MNRTKRRSETRRLLPCLLLCAALLTGCAVNDAPAEESDAAEAEAAALETAEEAAETESAEEMTIATTSPAICQILEALDYDNVVGIPDSDSVPECFQDATVIGAPMTPDTEILCQLDPDLVLSPMTLESSLAEEYTQAGLSAAFLNLGSVESMYDAITSLGQLLDREEQAEALAAGFESDLAAFRADKSEGPSVLVLMCYPDGFYLVASEDCYVGSLVALAGGRNVYADYEGDQEGFISVNPEDMVQKNPDVILAFAHYNEEAAFTYMENEFATNPTWDYYDAVAAGNVFYLPSDLFGMSATLDWRDSLTYLESCLYGD